MSDGARLIDVAIPPRPEGVVLLLHGGASRRDRMRVSPAQLSVLRMIPVGRRVARASRRRLAVLRLLNARRGWDSTHTPLDDVAWALDQIAARFGADMGVCLIGHSLGGRAALLSAGAAQVRGVVALAPWVQPTDPLGRVHDTPVVIIHGDADRVAVPGRSRQLAARLARQTPVSYVSVREGKHAMLSRRGCFDGLAASCAVWMLLGELRGPLLAEIAAGRPELVV